MLGLAADGLLARFKAYNDTFGHPAGDALLTRLGSALARAVDGQGRAYRMGGDEFCVLSTAPAERHVVRAFVTALERTEHDAAAPGLSGLSTAA